MIGEASVGTGALAEGAAMAVQMKGETRLGSSSPFFGPGVDFKRRLKSPTSARRRQGPAFWAGSLGSRSAWVVLVIGP